MENCNQLLLNQRIKIEEPIDESQFFVEKEPILVPNQVKQEEIEPDVKPDSIPVPAVPMTTPKKFLYPVKVCNPPPPALNRWNVLVPPILCKERVASFDPNMPIGVLLRQGYKFKVSRPNPPPVVRGQAGVQDQKGQLYKRCLGVYHQHIFQPPGQSSQSSQPGPSNPPTPVYNHVGVPHILYRKRKEDVDPGIPPLNPLIGEDPTVDVIDLELSQALKKDKAKSLLFPVKPPPRIINRKRNRPMEENKQLPGPSEVSPAKTMSIKESLADLDREYEREHANHTCPDWLSGNGRQHIAQNFQRDMHPSPKTILEISEKAHSTYPVVFRNYQRLRMHYGIRCEPNDNCERICRYFQSGTQVAKARLRADEQCLLDKTLMEFCEKNIKMTVGQLHVFADEVGQSPHGIKTRYSYLRKDYLQNLQRTDEEREVERRQLMFQFTSNPFPDPGKYLLIAAEFKMKYEQVQRFFNSERMKHVKMHGAYEKVELSIDEQASETLWDMVRQKKHLNFHVRMELSKKLKISYKTVCFWVDKFASELRYGVEEV